MTRKGKSRRHHPHVLAAAVGLDARDLAREFRNRQQFGGAGPTHWPLSQPLDHAPIDAQRSTLLRLTATSTSTLWVGSTVTSERVITSDIREAPLL